MRLMGGRDCEWVFLREVELLTRIHFWSAQEELAHKGGGEKEGS